MSFKDDLLRKLSVSKLKLLAEQNKISLSRERTDWNSLSPVKYTLTDKDAIIEALISSSKITEKKIRKFTEPSKTKIVRKRIPFRKRMRVWRIYNGELTVGKCYTCGRTIYVDDFDCGHNKAVVKKGSNEIDNLRPICRGCNSEMGTKTIESFKKQLKKKT